MLNQRHQMTVLNTRRLLQLFANSKDVNVSNKHPLATTLHQANTYLREIEHLQQKLIVRNRLYDTLQDDVSFYQFCMNSKQLAEILANSIKSESYAFTPAKPRIIQTRTKQRTVYKFAITDRLVQFALHHCLTPYVKELISESVYSYIPGRSNFQAARKVAQYIKQHESVFALRSDIVAYTDNIPTDPSSQLWQQLDHLLCLMDPSHDIGNYIRSLVTNSIRPCIEQYKGHSYQMTTGLPQGAPMTTIAANLYLQPIDNLLSSIPNGCYARFGDDLLFLHTEKSVLLEAEDLLNKQLTKLKLYRNAKKDEYRYITSNGRRHVDMAPFRNSHFMPFLGFSVNHNGTLGIGQHITHRLLRSLKRRIRNTITLTSSRPSNEHGPLICAMLNKNLMSLDPLNEPRLKMLLDYTTDRQQLKQLDYQIALYLAQQLSGLRSVKAFRKISYRTIRNEWGLESLSQVRNRFKVQHHD